MGRRTLPATLDEFVVEWGHYIDWCVTKVAGRMHRDVDVQDLKQQVYVRLLEGDLLGRYVPARGNISTYLWQIIRSVVMNQSDKNQHNPVYMAAGLSFAEPEDARPATDGRRVVAAQLQELQDDSWERRLHARDVLARFEQYVGSKHDGAQLLEILRMIHEGYGHGEIAAQLGVKVARVAQQRKRLKSLMGHQRAVGALAVN